MVLLLIFLYNISLDGHIYFSEDDILFSSNSFTTKLWCSYLGKIFFIIILLFCFKLSFIINFESSII